MNTNELNIPTYCRYGLLLIMLLSCTNSFSQKKRLTTKKIYTKGQVLLKNGKIITGEIGFPIYNAADVHLLNIKKSEDQKYVFVKTEGTVEKILQNEIDVIQAESNSRKILLKRTEVYRFTKVGKKSYEFQYWLDFQEGCEKMQGYLIVNRYDLTNDGQFIALYLNNEAEYALISEGEEIPTIVGMTHRKKEEGTGLWNKERRQKLQEYFKNNKEGMAFANSKKKITPLDLSNFINAQCN